MATTSALAPYPYLQMVWMIVFGYAGVRPVSRPLDARRRRDHRGQRPLHRPSRAPAAAEEPHRAQRRGRGAGKKALKRRAKRWHKTRFKQFKSPDRGGRQRWRRRSSFRRSPTRWRVDGDGLAGAARQPAGRRRDARAHQGACARHRLYLQPPRRQPAHLALGHRRRRRPRHHEPVLRRDPALDRKRARPQPPDLHPLQPLRSAGEAAHLHRHAAAARRRRRHHVAGDRHAGRGHPAGRGQRPAGGADRALGRGRRTCRCSAATTPTASGLPPII